jgi:hypothetical protein
MSDPFAPIAGGGAAVPAKAAKAVWTAIMPVPAEAPAPPRAHL